MGTDSCTYKFQSHRKISQTRRYFRVFFVVALVIILALWMDYWLRGEMGVAKKFAEFAGYQWGAGVLIGGVIFYVLLLSLPFVPGVELGVLLMCIFGKEGIVFAYFATLAGLSLAFFMGRKLPLRWVKSSLEKLGFAHATEHHVDDIDGMLENFSLNDRFCHNRLISFILKYRYPAIGILFNIPGNYLIGGGGGIALACGISRNISWKWFFLTVVVAVSPVPLLAWFGVIQLEAFLGIK
jgi:hypothetical protein